VPDRFVSTSERFRRERVQSALPTILFADADPAYREMARDALLEGRSPSDLRFASDGQDLLDYLHRRGGHTDPISSPRPALIVLDLKLPKLGGIEAVRTIKSNPELRRIPIVALTDDDDPEAVGAAYDAGVNTYLSKPVTFLALVKLMKVFTAYWLDTALLPPVPEAA
jgi:two-component system, response regulator